MKHTLIALLTSLAMNFSITDVLAQSQTEPYAQLFEHSSLSEEDQKILATLQRI